MVLGLDIYQYLSGEDTFSGFCPPTRPPTPLMQTPHTPGGYQIHAKDLLFYFVLYMKEALLISFSALWGCWWAVRGVGGLLGGVGEPLSFHKCFGKDMSINRALVIGYMGRPKAVRQATQARVKL